MPKPEGGTNFLSRWVSYCGRRLVSFCERPILVGHYVMTILHLLAVGAIAVTVWWSSTTGTRNYTIVGGYRFGSVTVLGFPAMSITFTQGLIHVLTIFCDDLPEHWMPISVFLLCNCSLVLISSLIALILSSREDDPVMSLSKSFSVVDGFSCVTLVYVLCIILTITSIILNKSTFTRDQSGTNWRLSERQFEANYTETLLDHLAKTPWNELKSDTNDDSSSREDEFDLHDDKLSFIELSSNHQEQITYNWDTEDIELSSAMMSPRDQMMSPRDGFRAVTNTQGRRSRRPSVINLPAGVDMDDVLPRQGSMLSLAPHPQPRKMRFSLAGQSRDSIVDVNSTVITFRDVDQDGELDKREEGNDDQDEVFDVLNKSREILGY